MLLRKCLVTGASGFLGRHVAEHLISQNYNVSALTRKPLSGLPGITGDLTRTDLDLGDQKYSVVYHLAGLAHRIALNQTESDRFFAVNHSGTRNLLKGLERTGHLPTSLVMVSTVAVYGAKSGTLLDETTPRNSVDSYGASKRAAEDLVLEWGQKQGVNIAILRLPLVVGAGVPGTLGAMVRALSRGRYVGVGEGSARRSMVLAKDVARILPRVASSEGIFHLTDGYHPSFAEMESALTKAMRRQLPPRLPLQAAKLIARIGDATQRVTGRQAPFSSRTFTIMTSTLTFSDERARRILAWNPEKVLAQVHDLSARSPFPVSNTE